jgi:hypothetical protein
MLLHDQAIITRLNSISPPYSNKRLRSVHHAKRTHSPIFHRYRDHHRHHHHLDKYAYRMRKCENRHGHQYCCCCCCSQNSSCRNKISRSPSTRHKSTSDESFRCSSLSPELSSSSSLSLSSPTWREYDAEQTPLELSADELARVKQQLNADLGLIELKLNTKNMNNEQLIKHNKILINYKKLSQVENCLMRSRAFLKKNFDLIYSQIKINNNNSNTPANDSPLEYIFNESSSSRNVQLPIDDNQDKDSLSSVSSPSPMAFSNSHAQDFGALKNITNIQKQRLESKVKEKKKYRSERNSTRAINKQRLRREKKEKPISNDLNNNSDTCINKNFINYRSTLSRQHEKQDEACKHKENFDAQVESNKPLDESCYRFNNSKDQDVHDRRISLLDLTENYKRQIDFSRSMIEFTLCLQKVLSDIDKVIILLDKAVYFNHNKKII